MNSLYQKFKSAFDVGVALGGTLPNNYSAVELDVIRSQFNVVTPENCMKPASIQPQEGEFTFEMADALTAFARDNGKKLTGHCLVWHQQTPDWFFKDGDEPASRKLLLDRMRTHIHTLVGRYRGQIMGWDVVNEAVDDKDDYLRNSLWLQLAGEDYLEQAFRFAREADPDVQLYYNDYSNEGPVKREKTLRLLDSLRDAGIKVDAVGIQGHWWLDNVPFAEIEESINIYAQTGLKVMITELDLSVLSWDPSAGDPYTDGCPQELLQRQAEQYAELFKLFLRHRDVITRVAFWNLNDKRSWLNNFPYKRTNHPLLFDRNCQSKPAYDAVMGIGE